uniref:sphingomyelin phosphodiesterase 4-like n=1 Tax=Ciona intestinalis TaxID=7719 RepID=UPI000180CE79|nr:sphingomyelin phosphodiesterase 4-like [Ciona intestinalis]|eukprot:XP_002130431.1 sphingomyelin phosphodiesterase 4-like [Ciona intestinalis]
MNGSSEHGILGTAFSKPTLSEKCKELTKIIDENTPKTLHHIYPHLIHTMFGIITPGWGIPHINPRQHALEFNLLRNFFGVDGPMLRLVHKLQGESILLRYDFPLNILPPALSYMGPVESSGLGYPGRAFGNAPYTSTATFLKGQTCVRVSAFEFYFFHFAHVIINLLPPPQPTKSPLLPAFQSRKPVAVDDNLYCSLVDDYLGYFLPIDGSYPPTMQSPVSNVQTPTRSSPWISHISSMIRKSPTKQTDNLGITQNEIWRSDTLVRVLVEFWLGQTTSTRINSTVKCPTEEVAYAVRRLIKHMHYFQNVNSSSLSYSHLNDTVMESFKQNISCNFLQPRLLEFLGYCFNVWPLNSSFRIILETWLSYIQPWRYADASTVGKNVDMRLSTDRHVANAWYHFIASNLPFYTQLLKESLTRYLRMDLSKQANSLLLYRVAKIFNQPNLMEMIEEAEEAQYGGIPAHMHSPSPGSYIASGRINDHNPINATVISSPELKEIVSQLLMVCQQALGTVQKLLDKNKPDFSTQVLKFIGFGDLCEVGPSNFNETSSKKSAQQLADSMQLLSEIFDVQIPELNESMRSVDTNQSQNPLGTDAPDCSLGEDGVVHLSSLGRHEIINNIKKLPVSIKCEPALQPIRSYECATLVRVLHSLSTYINKKYEAEFKQFCSLPGFSGKFAKFIFNIPHSPNTVDSNQLPTISFRFFAHYRTIFYTVMFFLLCYLFDYGVFRSFALFLFLSAIYLILKAVVLELKVKHTH